MTDPVDHVTQIVRKPDLIMTLDVSAIPAQAAGAGQYVFSLARGLAAEPSVSTTLVSRRNDASRWLEGPNGGTDASRPAARPRMQAIAPRSRPLRLAWEQAVFPHWLNRERPDVHHSPHYTMPELARVPTVVTVHDCTFFDHPEWHERSKVLLFRRAIRVAARRADAIICVSRTTADHLVRVCDVKAPIFVAPHGFDRRRFSPDEVASGEDAALLNQCGIDPDVPFIAFVGTIEPRKGVSTLIRAFAMLQQSHRELSLVIAGQLGWGTSQVSRALQEVPRPSRVVQLGYVADPVVPALLRNAAAVAYPSLAEGYGLPALEALACGAKLVTTSGTAMAELAGDAALLVPPGDPAALADALHEVMTEPAGRADKRRMRSIETASGYTWARSVQRHLEAYRQAAGAGGHLG